MIYCLIAFIVEKVHEVNASTEDPYSPLGWLFIILLFMNLYVTAFNMNLKSFIILIVIGVMSFVILLLTNVINVTEVSDGFEFDMGLISNFYLLIFIMLAVLLVFAIIESRFHYIEIEKQELQIHGFLESGVKQYNSADMTYEIDYSDIFEFLAARAGSITFHFKDGNAVVMDTVINLKKVKANLDEMRNSIAVKVQQH